ncbi:type VI secretion protein [Frateuria sp. Soil773]|uniref:type VI secretion system protein TssA n=1 Tax=Frateuria sp. Soil773 TaxID=1736407 RepID=UPI0006FA88EE|nr:type VI secretion system protein TssA [Frateuria sp. Soil773]KRE89967.1 type VI secretion protein [Frateuria sp. Soil773]
MNHNALESFLAPLSDESPCGENLEYDADFLALERAAAPKAERAVGDSVKAAEEPDWDKVAALAENLLGRSRDLRVAVYLATAWMRTSGLAGWAAGLRLIRGFLEDFWDGVHPLLDAEDDDDPTARVNAVVPIGDLLGVLGYLRTTSFVQSPRLGRFSLRDLRIANGTLKIAAAEDGASELPTMTIIEACCQDCPEEQLSAAAAAINEALEHAIAIDGVFNARIGTAGPDLKTLLGDMRELKKFLDAQLAQRSPQSASSAGDEAPAECVAAGAPAAASGRIESAQDVIRRIDELCEYYDRVEPSSPVPLLLRRAQRLVGMNFMDLLKDLAPGGVSELQVISGSSEDD